MKRPQVTIKFAETLDGKIAAKDKSSRWISSPESRKFSHKLRSETDAILVGIGTVLADDPGLTVRLVKGKNPIRVILDRRLRIPLNSKIVNSSHRVKTIIVTAKKASGSKAGKLRKKGIELLFLNNIKEALSVLYKKGIKTILVEGGKQIITAFMKAGLVDRLIVIIAPKIVGKGVTPVGDLNINNINSAINLRIKTLTRQGQNIIITAV